MRFDPRTPYDVHLACHADFPLDERPTFVFRRVSVAESLAIFRAFDDAQATAGNRAEQAAVVIRAASIGLVGWRNQVDLASGEAVAFDLAALDRIVGWQEAVELLSLRRTQGRPTGNDRKNSASPQLSAAASSANGAAAESASTSPAR